MTKSNRTLALIFLPVIVLCGLFWNQLPAADAQSYFDFADKRGAVGISNVGDVFSNLGFIAAGLWGIFRLQSLRKKLDHNTYWLGLIFAIGGGLLTGLGSAYFHWLPTEERLYWDRLPMMIGFVSVMALLLADRFDPRLGMKFFWSLAAYSFLALTMWHWHYWTLRPYLSLQFGCLLVILFFIVLRPKGKIGNLKLGVGLAFYVGAKFFELWDRPIFDGIYFVSGHSLKHLSAAVAVACVLWAMTDQKSWRQKS